MSSKQKTSTKAQRAKSKSVQKIAERRTAKVSRERLSRIAKTRNHSLRSTNRIFKYGAKSFLRNAWLSIAAIAIMTITLIIISATVIATHVMDTAVRELEARVDVSVYIRQTATRAQVENIANGMKLLGSVDSITIVSPTEANDSTIDIIASDVGLEDRELIDSLREVENILPWTIKVTMKELGNIEELKNYVDNDPAVKDLLDAKEPTYDSDDRATIENISNTTKNIQLVGFIAAGGFALIAILIVFNTIRMAIFNRKEEIYMMRLVGASSSFIVGPFLVEASLYGVIAALIAAFVAYLCVYGLEFASDFASLVEPTFALMIDYWYAALACLLALGVLIGVISALLAARKYLRAK